MLVDPSRYRLFLPFLSFFLSFFFCADLQQLPGILYGVEEFAQSESESEPPSSSSSFSSGSGASEPPLPGERPHVSLDPRCLRVPLQLDITAVQAELRRLGRQFESTVYELRLDDGSRHLVFPRQVQINPREFSD